MNYHPNPDSLLSRDSKPTCSWTLAVSDLSCLSTPSSLSLKPRSVQRICLQVYARVGVMCYGMLHGFSGQAQSSLGHSHLPCVCVTAAVLSFRAYSYSSMLLSLCFCMPLFFSASHTLHPFVTSPCFMRGGGRKPAHIRGCQNVWYSKCALLQKHLFFSVWEWDTLLQQDC